MRAHDNPVTTQDAHDLALTCLKFFELAGYGEIANSTFRPKLEETHVLCAAEAIMRTPSLRSKFNKLVKGEEEEEEIVSLPAKRIRRNA